MVSIEYVHINLLLVPTFPLLIRDNAAFCTSLGIGIFGKLLVVTTEERNFVFNPVDGRFFVKQRNIPLCLAIASFTGSISTPITVYKREDHIP